MAVTISVRVDTQGQVQARLGDECLATTPVAALPTLTQLSDQCYLFREGGRVLMVALGGEKLMQCLLNDQEGLLLLDLDTRADTIPWEFAIQEDKQFLVCQYGCLRLVNRHEIDIVEGPLRLIFLGADPLVDHVGKARELGTLNFDREVRAIQNTLPKNAALEAKRIPPTIESLRKHIADERKPTILHISCHGSVEEKVPRLLLEDEDGVERPLIGQDLVNIPLRGILRMVFLSACQTDIPGDQDGPFVKMARSMVSKGVPFAVGFQGDIPVKLSHTIAGAFYGNLLASNSLSEALRLGRVELQNDPCVLGLPVGYSTCNGWRPIDTNSNSTKQTSSSTQEIILQAQIHLPREVRAPHPLLGRNIELHKLAKLYSSGKKVVNISGAPGIGKSALAASFAEHFGWRWKRGVYAISLSHAVTFIDFCKVLLSEFCESDYLSNMPPDYASEYTRVILDRVKDLDRLLLLDNYESVVDRYSYENDASDIHQLVQQIANEGLPLLITSRIQHIGFKDEVDFPEYRKPLDGLETEAAASLFMSWSTKARESWERGPDPEHKLIVDLAKNIASVTAGHPLAIILLAGEYDNGDIPCPDFLKNWSTELAHAERPNLPPYQQSFHIAFDRSYNQLASDLQYKLLALSVFDIPFYHHGAVCVWRVSDKEAVEALNMLTRRNLICVNEYGENNTPLTYRLLPPILHEAAGRLESIEIDGIQEGYKGYLTWLMDMGYKGLRHDPVLARIVQQSLDALEAHGSSLTGDEKTLHVQAMARLRDAMTRPSFAERNVMRNDLAQPVFLKNVLSKE
jgi:hypothetical protein